MRKPFDQLVGGRRQWPAGGIAGLVVLQCANRYINWIGCHLIDILLASVEKLANVAIDLAYFPRTAIHKLINCQRSCVGNRNHCDQAHGYKSDQYERKHKLIFYFHREAHKQGGRANGQIGAVIAFTPDPVRVRYVRRLSR
ncbi:hypothetical protein D3C75_924270 [compost metagenome]